MATIYEDYNDIQLMVNKNDDAKKVVHSTGYFFRLGETVNNGIRYFGKQKRDKERVTALFICHCGDSWRCRITSIVSGMTTSCGCSNGKKLNREE